MSFTCDTSLHRFGAGCGFTSKCGKTCASGATGLLSGYRLVLNQSGQSPSRDFAYRVG